MSAKQLRKLSGVYVRKREGADATGIQRMHEKDRSLKIAEYVRAGYPFGDLTGKQQADPTNDSQLPDDFELPVVAFHGLDIGWQAYLFWSINVSPKKINPSHAYDLFPLLRTQDWLETVSSVHVYREARAQELTDLLYRHSGSPWNGRINMLGERKSGWVSQAGWVQAIYNSFLSPGLVGRSRKGLFAANLSTTAGPLDWSRPQQVALLIFIWQKLREAVRLKADGCADCFPGRADCIICT